MHIQEIRLICFAGSYAVALGFELFGAVIPDRLRRALVLGWTFAGIVAQCLYIFYRAAENHAVLSTCFDSLMALSWLLAITFLVAQWNHPEASLGLLVLPVVLILIGLSALLEATGPRLLTGTARIWGPLHGAIVLAGGIAAFVAFLAGLMYLAQANRLKRKKLVGLLGKLPSLERLEKLTRGGIGIAFILLTVGLSIGLLLMLELRRQGVEELSVLDPKVIAGIAAWAAFALLLRLSRHPSLRGRRVALLTIASFALLVATFVGVDLLASSWHQGQIGPEP
jgi:ABC-type uncharacterized transport system permease subunit